MNRQILTRSDHPSLILPRLEPSPQAQGRPGRRRRRRPGRWLQAGQGLMLASCGVGILLGLMRLPERIDTLLLVSNAIFHLIAGLRQLGQGLLQLAAMVVVLLLTLMALIFMVGGGVRIYRALAPSRKLPSASPVNVDGETSPLSVLPGLHIRPWTPE